MTIFSPASASALPSFYCSEALYRVHMINSFGLYQRNAVKESLPSEGEEERTGVHETILNVGSLAHEGRSSPTRAFRVIWGLNRKDYLVLPLHLYRKL